MFYRNVLFLTVFFSNTTIFIIGGWDRFDHHLPLSSSIIDLLLECMSSQETWLTKAPVPLAVKIVAGKKIEHFFQVCLKKDVIVKRN